MYLINKKLSIILSLIFLFEVFSFYGFLFAEFNSIVFWALFIFVFMISLKNIEYGLWFAVIELMISSKGYLFYSEIFGHTVSIRIAFFVAILSAWFIYFLRIFFKNTSKTDKLNLNYFVNLIKNSKAFRSKFLKPYLVFFIFIIFGVLSGLFNQNNLGNIFLDSNAWLYFLYIFPIYSIYFHESINTINKVKITNLFSLILAGLFWIIIKTYFLLFIFTHNSIDIISKIYLWVRKTGVGEITKMDGGFYRIFFQSHIFALIGFFIIVLSLILYYFNNKKDEKKGLIISSYLFSIFLLSVVLISFSRSNWLGLFIGLFLLLLFILYKYGIKKMFISSFIFLSIFFYSVLLIIAITKFPFPQATNTFSPTNLLKERAQQISGEAGVSSRWSLLPVLYDKIKEAPILGSGFGTTVSYKSSDPRILESNIDGNYTTYAFEWGWLDIWIKLGLLGFLAYLYLLVVLIFYPLKHYFTTTPESNSLIISFSIGVIVLVTVSFFSPYLNHPLGIGYLLIFSVLADNILSKKMI